MVITVTGRGLLAPAHLVVLAALQYVYLADIAPRYGYQGLIYDFDALRAVGSYFILLGLALLTMRLRTASLYFSNIAILTIITPSLVMWSCAGATDHFIIVTALCFAVICLVARFAKVVAPAILSMAPTSVLRASTMLSVLLVGVIAAVNGLTLNFNLSDVYEAREVLSETTSGLMSYVQTIASKAVLPLAVALACVYRQRTAIIVLCLLGLFLFGLTSHKSMALYPIIVVALYFATASPMRLPLLLLGTAVLVLLSSFDAWLYTATGSSPTSGWLLSLVPRRGLMVPAQINSLYVEFFSTHAQYYWSMSRLTLGLVSAPYDIPPPQMIAYSYWGSQFSVNAGWIGAGFAQAGLLGAAIYSVVLGLVFSFFDDCADRLGSRVVVPAGIVPVLAAITSTDVVTLFLTHGLVVTMIALLLIRPSLPRPRTVRPRAFPPLSAQRPIHYRSHHTTHRRPAP